MFAGPSTQRNPVGTVECAITTRSIDNILVTAHTATANPMAAGMPPSVRHGTVGLWLWRKLARETYHRAV
jgi:hypothetical protein